MNFSSMMFFSDINHGYRAAILKKNPLWLLPFYMAVDTSCYYEKVRRTMRTAGFLGKNIFFITNNVFYLLKRTCNTPNFLSGNKMFCFSIMNVTSPQKWVRTININPLSANPTKWPQSRQSRKLPTNCLSVFGHFINLALKGLKISF